MSYPPEVLVPPCPPAADDPQMADLLEIVARAAGAGWVQVDLLLDGAEGSHRFSLGTVEAQGDAAELRLPGRFQVTLTLPAGLGLEPALAALVTRVVDHILESGRLRRQVELLGTALDADEGAVLLFDRQSAIVYANAEADRLLASQTENGLSVRRSKDRGEPLFGLLCAVAEQLVASTVAAPSWRGRLALSDGTALACELLRLDPGEDPLAAGAAPAVLARLKRTAGPPELQVDGFAASWGLSRREEEVLRLLVAGSSVAEVAERLGISPHTVRDHVKRLYRKTGSSSRNELLRHLASSTVAPPVDG